MPGYELIGSEELAEVQLVVGGDLGGRARGAGM